MSIVYIAAPFGHADTAEGLAQFLQKECVTRAASQGVRIISRWHRIPAGVMSLAEAFTSNMCDLQTAKFLIILTYKDSGKETYTELGMHLARQRRVLWLPQAEGECLSLLQSPLVSRFGSQEELSQWFKMLSPSESR